MSRKRSLSVASQGMSTPTPAAKTARTGSMESPGQAVQQGQVSPAVLQQLSQKHRVPTAVVANALNLQMRQLAARQLQHQQHQQQQAATQQQQAAMQQQHQQAVLRERAVKQHQQRLQAAGLPSQHANGQARVQADPTNPYWAPWM
jgi:3-oxoacyl-ACP reductase-like protein